MEKVIEKEVENSYYEIQQEKKKVQDFWRQADLLEERFRKLKEMLRDIDSIDKYEKFEKDLESAIDDFDRNSFLNDRSFPLIEEIVFENERKKEELYQKKKRFSDSLKNKQRLLESSDEFAQVIKENQKKIDDYLKKIEEIKAIEVTGYRFRMMQKATKMIKRSVRRTIEAKIIEQIAPKKVAELYLALQLLRDSRKIMQEDEIVVIKKEVDVSYYDDIKADQKDFRKYQNLLQDALKEIKAIQIENNNEYKNFPSDVEYDKNMKELEEVEKILIQEEIAMEEIIDDYENTMDKNNQKIKMLKE